MINTNITKNFSLTLFLVISTLFPTFALSKADITPSIEIVQQENVFDIEIRIPDELYLTDETLDVTVVGEGSELESIFYQDSLPFDDHDVYFTTAKIKAIVKAKVNSTFKIVVDYQSCSRKHECSEVLSYEQTFKALPPVQKKILNVPEADEVITEPVTEQDGIVNMLKDKSLLITLLTFFGFGLLLAFTPCMLPVIPILSAVIICKQENMTSRRGFLLSLTYVLSMSFVYALAGILAASLGSNIQAFFQQTWIIILFSALFFILSLAMFGTFNIEMPKKLQSLLTSKSACSERRTYFSVVVLGILSALIVGPCVAPPLAGALIYISQTGNEMIGGLSLFVMSLGMGIPLLLLGAGAGRFLPKPGQWMETVKLIFGFVMLAFSVWILSRIIDYQTVMFLWGVILICLAVAMDLFEARTLIESYLHYQEKKIFSLLSLIFGTILIVGALGGATDIKYPLEPFTAKSVKTVSSNGIPFKTISANEMQSVIDNSTKPIMFTFTADWCDNCKELQKDVFSKNDVAEELSGFELYKIDVTDNTDKERALLKKFALFGPPGIIFFDKDKNELSSHRLIGYKEKKDFLQHIEIVKKVMQE